MFEFDPADITARSSEPSSSGPGLARLSSDQRDAVGAIKSFLYDSDRRVFALQGLAGTGKSYLLASIARSLPGALICAPTGHAAAVLRQRSGLKASTIHAAFYRLKGEAQRADGRRDLTFEPRRRAGSLTDKLVLIDEASMVPATMVEQLLATRVRIIAFGDPGQLPPVQGEPGFPHADFTLRQIHRQAAGSAIIRQAHRVRAGGDYGSDGCNFQVVAKGSHALLREANVVLVHRNDTRRRLNQLARRVALRSEVPGSPAADGSFDPATEFPRQFERVVVLRNAPRHNLWNGDVEWLGDDLRPGDRTVSLFRVSESGSSAGGVEFPLLSFAGMPGTGGVAGGLELDFGYVLTTHKAQGSEWPFVVLVDEFPRGDPQRKAWVYTALTRASQRIVIVNRHCR